MSIFFIGNKFLFKNIILTFESIIESKFHKIHFFTNFKKKIVNYLVVKKLELTLH